MAERPLSLQDHFLNSVRRSKGVVTIFLVKGVKLQGVITGFDSFSLLLRREGASQLVYKHSISTIMPHQPVAGFTPTSVCVQAGRAPLQDLFLSAAARDGEELSLFLVNGVMLQGRISGFDQFALLVERGPQMQLVYKHALSTLQPGRPLKLDGGDGEARRDDDAV